MKFAVIFVKNGFRDLGITFKWDKFVQNFSFHSDPFD